jgi:signal recognition particle GTPase
LILCNQSVAQNADIVIIDTAGRLHNKINLNELTKVKSNAKVVADAPHDVLVLMVNCQNALNKQNSLLQLQLVV